MGQIVIPCPGCCNTPCTCNVAASLCACVPCQWLLTIAGMKDGKLPCSELNVSNLPLQSVVNPFGGQLLLWRAQLGPHWTFSLCMISGVFNSLSLYIRNTTTAQGAWYSTSEITFLTQCNSGNTLFFSGEIQNITECFPPLAGPNNCQWPPVILLTPDVSKECLGAGCQSRGCLPEVLKFTLQSAPANECTCLDQYSGTLIHHQPNAAGWTYDTQTFNFQGLNYFNNAPITRIRLQVQCGGAGDPNGCSTAAALLTLDGFSGFGNNQQTTCLTNVNNPWPVNAGCTCSPVLWVFDIPLGVPNSPTPTYCPFCSGFLNTHVRLVVTE
jgi:hypothetical protein